MFHLDTRQCWFLKQGKKLQKDMFNMAAAFGGGLLIRQVFGGMVRNGWYVTPSFFFFWKDVEDDPFACEKGKEACFGHIPPTFHWSSRVVEDKHNKWIRPSDMCSFKTWFTLAFQDGRLFEKIYVTTKKQSRICWRRQSTIEKIYVKKNKTT